MTQTVLRVARGCRRGSARARAARLTVRATLFACALVAGARPALAQGSLTIDTNPDSALAYEISRIPGEPLALADAAAAALAHATAAREAEAAVRAAGGEARTERGAFDPELFLAIEKRNEEAPTASPFSGADILETEETATSAGARMRLPFGAQIEASLDATRLETNSAFAALVPQYDASGRLAFRQPLLRGFGPAAWSARASAERLLESSRASRDDAVLAVRAELETTYWALYAAERAFGVQRLVVDRARTFLAEARVREAAGLVGPNQVANARVFLAEQELDLIDNEELLDGISDRLATLMGRRPGAGLPRFRSVDEPSDDFATEPQDSLVAQALRANHSVRAAERVLAALRAESRGAAWDALPAVDVIGSIGGNGLAGTPRDVIFGGDTLRASIDKSDFGDSWSQVTGRDFPTWSVGIDVSLPIFMRQGRGERDRLRGEVERAEQQLIAVQRDVETRVRANYRELSNGTRRMTIARDGVAAALEEIRIALIEYQNGRTTAFEVVRVGADLPRAQQRLSLALVRTARASAELKRLTTTGFADAASAQKGPSQ